MSCPNNEATKLESKKDHECKENCEFNHNYNPNSSCVLTNKGNYLETVEGTAIPAFIYCRPFRKASLACRFFIIYYYFIFRLLQNGIFYIRSYFLFLFCTCDN